MPIANIHESEDQDFETELRRHRRSRTSSILWRQQKPLSQQPGVISPYKGKITIKNKATGVERTYETGHASTWIAAFSDDLKKKVL